MVAAVEFSRSVQEQIDLEGPVMRNKLVQTNPHLNPKDLVSFIPAYVEFERLPGDYLWARRDCKGDERAIYPKVFLLLSGVSAAGKHEILRRIHGLLPGNIVDLVTATTRQRKPEEEESRDHYFYSLEQFLREKAADEFIEFVEQSPGRWYGTPKKSITAALDASGSVIVSDVEMGSGWPSVENYIASLPREQQPKVIKVFMLPEINAQRYFEQWLTGKRPQDCDSRGIRAAWEICEAAKRADFILTNPIGEGPSVLDKEAELLIEQIKHYLPNPVAALCDVV